MIAHAPKPKKVDGRQLFQKRGQPSVYFKRPPTAPHPRPATHDCTLVGWLDGGVGRWVPPDSKKLTAVNFSPLPPFATPNRGS